MIFVTVEHSGTRQTMIELGIMTCAHLTDENMPEITGHDGPVYTTYRPEHEIRATWERKKKDLAELDRQLRNWQTIVSRGARVIHLGENRWRS